MAEKTPSPTYHQNSEDDSNLLYKCFEDLFYKVLERTEVYPQPHTRNVMHLKCNVFNMDIDIIFSQNCVNLQTFYATRGNIRMVPKGFPTFLLCKFIEYGLTQNWTTPYAKLVLWADSKGDNRLIKYYENMSFSLDHSTKNSQEMETTVEEFLGTCLLPEECFYIEESLWEQYPKKIHKSPIRSFSKKRKFSKSPPFARSLF